MEDTQFFWSIWSKTGSTLSAAMWCDPMLHVSDPTAGKLTNFIDTYNVPKKS